MAGDIYSRQKCSICNGPLIHDPKRRGCFCKDHPHVSASTFILRFPGNIYRNFADYIQAEQELNYLRHEKGSRARFNPDDYRSARPNSFRMLKDKYLKRKENLSSFRDIARYINRAADYFDLTNIRDISGADIEDYLFSIQGISEKTRHNHMTQLRDFWSWCLKRGNIISVYEMPMFPDIHYELGRRKLTDWNTQELILSTVKDLSYHVNPKIWFGIDILATYTALRPDDLRRVHENSLDVQSGFLTIFNPTKRKNKFKVIRLIDDHVKTWRELQRQFPAMPDMPFFRHNGGINRVKAGEPFGEKYLYKWWTKACIEIGLEGVPLYPGTKHTTATETARLLGTEKALTASGLTNKAFNRYCEIENSDSFETVTAIMKKKKKSAEVLRLKKRDV